LFHDVQEAEALLHISISNNPAAMLGEKAVVSIEMSLELKPIE
jgi:hypothetical protein